MTKTSADAGQILSVTSECVPLIKSGGLADVAGALPSALAPHGWRMRVLLPAYPGLAALLDDPTPVCDLPDLFGGTGQILAGTCGQTEVLLLEAPHLFTREGGPYLDPDGRDYPDNPERFAALCWAAMVICRDGLPDGWRPDLVHAHDWQGGLVPAYLQQAGLDIPSVLTIHNIAFQGLGPAERLQGLRLDPALFTPEGPAEFWGKIGALKAGLSLATQVTTVSPRYATELELPEFGMGLEGVIAALPRPIAGILNGIDTESWSPETDAALVANYTATRIEKRKLNRIALAERFGLDLGEGPLAAVVSRLTRQKGLDLLPPVIPDFLARGGRLAVLGSGDVDLEAEYAALAARYPAQVGLLRGFDEPLAHQIYAGADALLVPSRFEPCGLTQLYALRYGAVPVVAATGGLADTVIAANPASLSAKVATGIVLPRIDAGGLAIALTQLCDLYADPRGWRQIQKNGLKADFGWGRSGAAYAALYAQLVQERVA
ncbi:glycogen synthase GlgA [Thioclava kandeliae]|uniref:Glycogen synthase n=1 Tax=Thioclava kandeliae TaxID=3070818 RepID=A0ABV1SJF7_9RHOB